MPEPEHGPAPRCSVVIPAYNSRAFIAETVQSALAQEGPTPEVIVVDDGSPDDTYDIVREIPGVRALRQENGGDSAARNTGLGETRAEFVLFLDHDDLLDPRAIRHHLAAFEAHPGADMTVGSNLLIDQAGARTGENILPARVFSAADVARGFTPSFSQCMYRRAALERIGGFRPEAGAGADHDLNLRLLADRPAGYCHGEIVMSYRLHQGQQTRSPSRLYRKHIAILREHLGPAGDLRDPDLLRQVERHWRIYYGQFMPSEVVRMLRAGKWGRAWHALATFLGCLPHSAIGAARFLRKKLG